VGHPIDGSIGVYSSGGHPAKNAGVPRLRLRLRSDDKAVATAVSVLRGYCAVL